MLNISVPKAQHPVLAKRDQNAIVKKLQTKMQESGMDVLIVYRPENIFYTTGYYSKISDNTGCVGINLSVVPAKGKASLVVTTLELEAAMSLTGDDIKVTSYPSYVFIDDGTQETRHQQSPTEIDAFTGLRRAVEIAVGDIRCKTIGVEKSFITVPQWEMLNKLLADKTIVDSTMVFTRARMIKTPWEIDMLRIAAQHCERTMYRVSQDVRPGMSCADMDNLMNLYAYEENKYFTADRNLFAAQAAGPYFGLSGMPRGYQIKERDIIRFDGGYRHLGYVSDLARCFCVGDDPEPEAVEIYSVLVEAFHKGIAMLKPGTVFKDIYHTMVDSVTQSSCIPFYPRGHMGHSVGMNLGLEEYPQISANMEEVLQPNMVICVEAPIWTNGRSKHYGAFSIEDTFLITEDGCERFTHGNETLIWR